jgi:hypothetical protein
LVGVTPPTIWALEWHGRSRLEILDRVLTRRPDQPNSP